MRQRSFNNNSVSDEESQQDTHRNEQQLCSAMVAGGTVFGLIALSVFYNKRNTEVTEKYILALLLCAFLFLGIGIYDFCRSRDHRFFGRNRHHPRTNQDLGESLLTNNPAQNFLPNLEDEETLTRPSIDPYQTDTTETVITIGEVRDISNENFLSFESEEEEEIGNSLTFKFFILNSAI